MADDVYMVLTQDDRPIRRVSPDDIERLPLDINSRVQAAMGKIKDEMVRKLRREFLVYIRERPRNSDYHGSSPVPLLQRMESAYGASRVIATEDEVGAYVFDLGLMDMMTRDEGFKTASRGWFMRYADGHEGRQHGSQSFGFITLEHAVEIAREISTGDPKPKADAFVARIKQAFAGRHGEGIMVRLDKPLFYDRPDAGTAREHGVQPHPGNESWPALDTVDGPANAVDAARTGGRHWILTMVEKAISDGMRGK